MPKCELCKEEWPALHEHHIIPQEYGGKDGPTAMLCARCHDCLHRQAKHWMAGKREKEYFPVHLRPLAKKYLQIIMAAALRYRELGSTGEPKLLSLKIEPELLVRLHKLKADRGYSSLEKFMIDVIKTLTKGY